MFLRVLLAFILSLNVVLAGPAVALSCIVSDPVQTFQIAANSSQNYSVLLGQFDFNKQLLPDREHGPEQAAVRIPAQFQGLILSRNGFVTPVTQQVILQPSCLSIWCGAIIPDRRVLAFVHQEPDGSWQLNLNECGGTFYYDPSRETLEKIVTCMQGGPCSPDQ
ncbi:hypothetical protein [Aestuariibius sp. HNIBRBA575]|uniref:hypothetical protein n=1 Tax=Aestuariibius sp. HNIBRBA575 TaxID=3233343 RepID=UPI0034A25BEC